jgi:hypothetical protein
MTSNGGMIFSCGQRVVESIRDLSPGAKATYSIWGLAIGWDVYVIRKGGPDTKIGDHQTISEAFARGLSSPRTGIFVALTIFIHVFHVFAMARHMRRNQQL